MKEKIMIIDLSDGTKNELSDSHKELLNDLQTELFKNGYRWIKSKREVQNFYSNNGYIVIIDRDMYKMTKNSVDYLSKNHDVVFVGNVVSYFRYMKLKKLKKI